MTNKNLSRILLFIVASVTIVATVFAYTFTVNREYRQKAFASIQQSSKEFSTSLNYRIECAFQSINLLADSVSLKIKNGDIENFDKLVDKLIVKTPFSSIEYIKKDGLCNLRGKDQVYVNDREYYKRGISGQSGIYVDYHSMLSKACRIVFYAPLIENNQVAGVLTGIITPNEDLTHYFNSSFFGKPILGILADESFNIIISSEDLFESGLNLYEMEANSLVQDILKRGNNGNENSFFYSSQNDSGAACITTLSSCGWHFIQILPSREIASLLSELNQKALLVSIFIVFVLLLYLFYFYYKSSKKTKIAEESHLNIINAFSLAYEVVYLVNMDSGKTFAYRDSPTIDSNFHEKMEYAAGDFVSGVNLYIANDVYDEDKELFYSIASLNKIEKILKDRTSYSFNYRVLRNGEIHYFQAELIRSAPESREFIIAIKNVDELMWKNKSRREIEIIQELFRSGRFSMDFDKDGKLISCNWSDEFRHLLGYNSIDSFPNFLDAWTDLIHPDDKDTVLKSFWSVINDKSNKKNFDMTYRLFTNQNRFRWFRSAGLVSRNQDGLPLHFVGMLVDVDDRTRLLKNLYSVSSIYHAMYTVDLINDELEMLQSQKYVMNIVNDNHNVRMLMINAMKGTVTEEYLPDMLEFTDLTTISKRLKGKKIISKDFVGKFSGWCRASFMPIEVDKDRFPIKVMFTTQVIEEDKMREINLMRLSTFDELTGCYNRHAYETDIAKYMEGKLEQDFVFVSIDVNGLKTINDNFGHEAGDELLIGAAKCMLICMGSYGRVYRTGGDEFQALLFATEEELENIQSDIDTTTNNWSGRLIDKVSLSCGFVSSKEYPDLNVRELAKIADERMYSAKSAYYSSKGIDRRGRQSAFDVLGKFLIKILKVNLTTENFDIIQVSEEQDDNYDFSAEKFSKWIIDFSNSDLISKSDQEDFIKNTDIEHLKNIFDSGKELHHLDYERNIDGKSKNTILEFIRAKNYSKHNRWVFVYVKDIEK